MAFEKLNLVINSINDITRCINLASLLEVSGWPKPGNIHRTRDFDGTRFEHLLAGIAAIQPVFRNFCEDIYSNSINAGEDYSFVKLGEFFKKAAKEMIKWQRGGNVLLGHILILAPLAAAASICLKSDNKSFKGFKSNLDKVINDTTVKDTIDLYEAIKICNPGGLGSIDKYDVNDENSIKDISNDKITLKMIFELSKEYDLISLQYATGFRIILNEGLHYYFDTFYQNYDVNIATVNLFLKILSEHPDTLIIRKSGLDSARSVSKQASIILRKGGLSTEKGKKMLLELDYKLQSQKGKMNPGTTADLVAGVIFCALIFGLKF